jgi:agmatine deiminase
MIEFISGYLMCLISQYLKLFWVHYITAMKFFNLKIVFLLIIFLIGGSCKNSGSDTPFHHPADFDPSASTYFIWNTDFNEIIPKLAAIISSKDKVSLVVGEKDELKKIEEVLNKYEGNLKNIDFIKMKNRPQNAWIRDFGPVYMVNSRGDKKLVNFMYYRKRQIFNEQVAEKLKLPVVQSPLSSTGGSREVNGKGTILLCEAHELAENYPKNKAEIEAELQQSLGIRKVIWLKQGIPQDDSQLAGPLFQQIFADGVNGHIDEFCRFADAGTVLISHVTDEEAAAHPILAEAKRRLDENYQILINSSDQDGNKLNVVKVPFAPLYIFEQSGPAGRRHVAAVTSYLNFIVTNSLVILPSYSSLSSEKKNPELDAKEQEVEKIFMEVFPTREVIKVQSADLNRFSGGFHCVSINEPAVRK